MQWILFYGFISTACMIFISRRKTNATGLTIILIGGSKSIHYKLERKTLSYNIRLLLLQSVPRILMRLVASSVLTGTPGLVLSFVVTPGPNPP